MLFSAVRAALEARFAPKMSPWPRWQAVGTLAHVVDHGPWQRFLDRYLRVDVDGNNRVDYGRVDAAGRADLADYLATLAATPVTSLPRAEQCAFWVNLYNALTIDLVLRHYPVKSILAIKPHIFAYGPWRMKRVEIDGAALTLHAIENRILRPIWRDPRLHYAVNCAARGCPNLQPTAFTAANTQALLDSAARAFVNHPKGARVDGGRLILSSIYNWFTADFGGTSAAVMAHLMAHAAPPLTATLRHSGGIGGYAYDWRLNEVSHA